MDNYQRCPKLESVPQSHLDRTGSGVQTRRGMRMAEVFGYEVALPPRSSTVTNVFGNKVDLLDELGRGGFGTVYKGCDKWGKMIAIKKVSKMDKAKANGEAVKFHYLKKKVFHEHIIKVYDVKSLNGAMWIMMEYCDLGDLNQFFKGYEVPLQHITFKTELMKQIISGITFLHSEDIVHRDIKPGNILLKSTSKGEVQIKLGDFGLSKILDPDSLTSAMSSNVGTNLFKAPEFWNHKPGASVKYHRNIDVYSAGLTFTAMLQAVPNKNLFPTAEGSLNYSETAMPIGFAANTRMAYHQPEFQVVENKPDDDETTTKVKELIRQMTCACSKKRLSSRMVKQRLDTMVWVSFADIFNRLLGRYVWK